VSFLKSQPQDSHSLSLLLTNSLDPLPLPPPPLSGLLQNFPRFTAWLGSYSTSNKQRRLLGELTNNLQASGHVHDGRAAVRLSYVPALRAVTTRPLADEESADVAGVVSLMQVRIRAEYCAEERGSSSIGPGASHENFMVPWLVAFGFPLCTPYNFESRAQGILSIDSCVSQLQDISCLL
jgi:hypothetical protein